VRAQASHERRRADIDIARLTREQARRELARLAAEIGAHDRRYYQEDKPTISDAEYDALRSRNAVIEARFPDLVRPDSPSRRIGAAPAGPFAKVRHRVPVLSLDNAFAEEAVTQFVARIRRLLKLTKEPIVFLAEPKMMVSPSVFATSGADSRGARPAATEAKVKMSLRTSRRSPTSLSASREMMCPRSARCAVRST
jgi:hypothetical protein